MYVVRKATLHRHLIERMCNPNTLRTFFRIIYINKYQTNLYEESASHFVRIHDSFGKNYKWMAAATRRRTATTTWSVFLLLFCFVCVSFVCWHACTNRMSSRRHHHRRHRCVFFALSHAKLFICWAGWRLWQKMRPNLYGIFILTSWLCVGDTHPTTKNGEMQKGQNSIRLWWERESTGGPLTHTHTRGICAMCVSSWCQIKFE